MDSNKTKLLISIIVLSFLSIIVGLVNILYSSKTKLVPSVSQGDFFKDTQEGAALIKIEGEIHSGYSTYSTTGADTILAKLREIEKKPGIKGILLQINSPGGTVGASQEIYEELMQLRKNKKIVVTMKDMAASGGYYIASAADYIYAEPGTITGSIGVIAVSPEISGLLTHWNVKMRVYKEGKYKDILSMFRDSTEEEESMIQSLLSDTYKRFLSDVARGRNKSAEAVQEMAEGRIFSGEAALQKGLVDAIGGRREAVKKLSELCSYDGTIPILEEEESPFDKFLDIIGSSNVSFSKEKILKSMYKSPVLVIFPYSIGLQ
ncbi:MAG: signal peptide peptidase SppA [Leptospiraceae bacterium]|nr:signal peptide peptidase SppA [Leptospiraceae bacterium]MCP5496215.1 signal peptide peptidase SppA [Leptospiraceae bacterium]